MTAPTAAEAARRLDTACAVVAAHRLVERVEADNRRRVAEARQVRARALKRACAAGHGLRQLGQLLGVSHARIVVMRDGDRRPRKGAAP